MPATPTFHRVTRVEFPEAEFPLIAEVGGKRYEVYSDGSFGEEELP